MIAPDQLLAAAIDHVRDEDDTQPFPATDLWHGYIQQIAGYVRGLKEQHGHALPRAVLTSGQWMIIFTDPVRTFIDGPARTDQFIILKKEAYLDEAALLFDQLSRANLGPNTPRRAVRPGQIADYCPPNALLAVFRALHVRYEAIGSRLFARHPKILVYPALILLRDDGAIIPVVEDLHRTSAIKPGQTAPRQTWRRRSCRDFSGLQRFGSPMRGRLRAGASGFSNRPVPGISEGSYCTGRQIPYRLCGLTQARLTPGWLSLERRRTS